jgi:beta-phosphoglucomutase
MSKTFIFDLDGVIVDTAKYHFIAWQNLANKLGINFTHEDNELLKGVSRVKSLEIILHMGNKSATEEERNVWLEEKNKEYLELINKMGEDEILPGFIDTLNFLKSKNQKIVLGSASKNAKLILDKVAILHLFDAIVDGNDVSKAKPDPEVFLKGAEWTKTEIKNCFVFEDAIAGIQAANVAGMTSIGIGSSEILTEAKYCFNGFNEIDNNFLLKLIQQ